MELITWIIALSLAVWGVFVAHKALSSQSGSQPHQRARETAPPAVPATKSATEIEVAPSKRLAQDAAGRMSELESGRAVAAPPPRSGQPQVLYEFDIVGESYRQGALESIAGPKGSTGKEVECTAVVSRERNNPHDPNALVVRINKKKVGYISRQDNKRLIAELGDEGFPLTVPAIIVGGWKTRESEGSFGVRLALPENSPPASQKDRAMVKYVEGKLPRGLTQNQVRLKVKQWNKSLDDRYIQWESLQEVIEHLQSADGREEFEIKKPSAAAIQAVFDRLVEEGQDPEDLAFSPDEIVARLLEENPKLAR